VPTFADKGVAWSEQWIPTVCLLPTEILLTVLQAFTQSPEKPVGQCFRVIGVCKTIVLLIFVASEVETMHIETAARSESSRSRPST
jgi:hypothetical protein